MSIDIPLKERSIAFIGFMGVGKTTIGRLVAKKLYRDFVDIDELIAKDFGMPIPEIFQKYGEKAFRQREKEIIQEYARKRLKVLSLGGGAFLQEEVKQICLQSCIVVFLDLSWDHWKERIELLVDSRPILQGKSIEEIAKLYDERKEIYSAHHLKMDTDHLNAEEAANYIVDSLKLAWELEG